MKRLKLILLFGLIAFSSNTQNFRRSTDKSMVVISTSGLHLREKPSSTSPSLRLINYGARVKLISEGEFAADTIRLINDQKIIGKWKKVRHQGIEGFMFRPYLLSISEVDFPVKRINKDYGLWYGSETCFNNIQYDKTLNWFAIGKKYNNTIVSKKVRPNYYWEKGAIVDNIKLETNLNFQPEFVLGTKENLKLEFTGIFNNISVDGFQEEKKINDQMFYEKNKGSLIYCYENREVDLNAPNLYTRGILWRGDLNEDDIDDFIIQYGEKYGKIVLFQSNPLNFEKPFEPVAEFTIGYCC